eukprot:1873354-Rhodomonas_salina.2
MSKELHAAREPRALAVTRAARRAWEARSESCTQCVPSACLEVFLGSAANTQSQTAGALHFQKAFAAHLPPFAVDDAPKPGYTRKHPSACLFARGSGRLTALERLRMTGV